MLEFGSLFIVVIIGVGLFGDVVKLVLFVFDQAMAFLEVEQVVKVGFYQYIVGLVDKAGFVYIFVYYCVAIFEIQVFGKIIRYGQLFGFVDIVILFIYLYCCQAF